MTRVGLRRALRSAPILLSGAYAESLTVGSGPALSLGLGAGAWILLAAGLLLGGRYLVPVALYGFGALTAFALLATPAGEREIPAAFLFLGWLAFALAWGSAFPSDPRTDQPSSAEIVSEGHEPLHRTGRLVLVVVFGAILAPVVALLWAPEAGGAEARLLARAVLTLLGVLLLALAGEVAARVIDLRPQGSLPRRPGKFLTGLVFWLASTIALLAVAERFSRGAWAGALGSALISGVGALIGLRLLRSAREN